MTAVNSTSPTVGAVIITMGNRPEELRALEPQLRERIAARLSRGKLDLVMRLRAPEAAIASAWA